MQKYYYNQDYNFGFQFMVVMSTQLIGFSIGGIAKRFLVSPPSMSTPADQRPFLHRLTRCLQSGQTIWFIARYLIPFMRSGTSVSESVVALAASASLYMRSQQRPYGVSRSEGIDTRDAYLSLLCRLCAWLSLHRTLVFLVGLLDQASQ